MRKEYRQWLGICVLLSGCISSPQSQTSHEVLVRKHSNAFLQTQEVAAWSISFYTDGQGNRWPTGLTLSAKSVRHHSGRQLHVLILRKDEAAQEHAPVLYQSARQHQQRLLQQCTMAELVLDGRSMMFPIAGITVRPLARRGLMPVPPTDSTPDPVETMVGENRSDNFILSTAARIYPDDTTWNALGSVQTLRYELCGKLALATNKELEGLREVVAQSKRLAEGMAKSSDP